MNEFSLGREEESSTSARPTPFLHIIILGMGNKASRTAPLVESLPHSLILWRLFIVIKWTLHFIFPLCGYDVLIGSFHGFLRAFCLVPAQDTDWTFSFLGPYSFLLHIVHSFPRGNHCNSIFWLSLLFKSSGI